MAKPQPSPTLVPIEKLHPAPRNPRVITESRLEALKKSMTDDPAFMWCRPVLAQKKTMDVYAGNMRLRAAISLGWKEIPAIITDIPEKLMRERQIRDNSEFGDWQGDELAQLLDEMKDMGTDLELLGMDDSFMRSLEGDGEISSGREVDVKGLEDGLDNECPRCHFRF